MPVTDKAVSYEIYSDERDQYGQRTKVMSAAKPGLVIRLNAGIYNVVGTYGDANAIARADVTVEAGKLTEATLTHAAAKVTFKLVARPGGDAIADTQWNVANAQGEVVKESVGALPTHVFAPGSYTLITDSLMNNQNPVPRVVRMDRGWNGGIRVYYATSVVILQV